MRKQYLFIDQYGDIFIGTSAKNLKDRHGLRGKPSKICFDDKDGNTFEVGYFIGQHWLIRYDVVRKKVGK